MVILFIPIAHRKDLDALIKAREETRKQYETNRFVNLFFAHLQVSHRFGTN